ncbi:hypothetical protein [Vibrio mexicanus]|uniref:hypothetical protein n=1 Tax=Vibrio mexicanus TaxID=1004326 RepID=UPI00063C4232|nr:hypothetical protein [Vibrio mexicanus]
MKRLLIALLLTASSTAVSAADKSCLADKYDGYIDASLAWYQDLAELTTTQYPELAEVSDWFLEGRKHHFELNRTAVHYYLDNEPSKVATEQSVESWLKLSQQDVKQLSERDDELGKIAKATFSDRQSKPHPKNYELRSAFADLLSHPKQIDTILQKYNQAIADVTKVQCD